MSHAFSSAKFGGGVSSCHASPASAPSPGCRPMLLKSGVTLKSTEAAPNGNCTEGNPGAAFTRIRGNTIGLLSFSARVEALALRLVSINQQFV